MQRRSSQKEKDFKKLLDALFKDITLVLDKYTIHIRKKKNLRDPDDSKKLDGLLLISNDIKKKDGVIYLNAFKNKDKLLYFLIHEALHLVIPRCHETRLDNKYTKICFENFTDEQKEILKRYLPKKEVKLNP